MLPISYPKSFYSCSPFPQIKVHLNVKLKLRKYFSANSVMKNEIYPVFSSRWHTLVLFQGQYNFFYPDSCSARQKLWILGFFFLQQHKKSQQCSVMLVGCAAWNVIARRTSCPRSAPPLPHLSLQFSSRRCSSSHAPATTSVVSRVVGEEPVRLPNRK